MLFRFSDGTMGAARWFTHNEINHPPAILDQKTNEDDSAWLARLSALGVAPVRHEQPDGFDPNIMDKGDPVETMADGWLVISWPNVTAKVPVWATATGEAMYISQGADIPDGYTDQAPPALARGLYTWDAAAGAWVENVEAMASVIRVARDMRLTATDWTVLPDSPLDAATQAECIAYRQALRDLTGQTGFPWQGDAGAAPWPDVPGVLE
jgi:hypothetical protein